MDLPGPVLWDDFSLLVPEEVDRVVAEVGRTTGVFDPCPSWLVKTARGGLQQWLAARNSCLIKKWRKARVPKRGDH